MWGNGEIIPRQHDLNLPKSCDLTLTVPVCLVSIGLTCFTCLTFEQRAQRVARVTLAEGRSICVDFGKDRLSVCPLTGCCRLSDGPRDTWGDTEGQWTPCSQSSFRILYRRLIIIMIIIRSYSRQVLHCSWPFPRHLRHHLPPPSVWCCSPPASTLLTANKYNNDTWWSDRCTDIPAAFCRKLCVKSKPENNLSHTNIVTSGMTLCNISITQHCSRDQQHRPKGVYMCIHTVQKDSQSLSHH